MTTLKHTSMKLLFWYDMGTKDVSIVTRDPGGVGLSK